jgi:hypothetical protein
LFVHREREEYAVKTIDRARWPYTTVSQVE